MATSRQKAASPKATPVSRAYASAGTALRITATEFVEWQDALGLSNGAAAAALYVSPNTITAARRDGASAELRLKCLAVAAGISAATTIAHALRLGRLNAVLSE